MALFDITEEELHAAGIELQAFLTMLTKREKQIFKRGYDLGMIDGTNDERKRQMARRVKEAVNTQWKSWADFFTPPQQARQQQTRLPKAKEAVTPDWVSSLGMTKEDVEAVYRRRAKEAHPDAGGSHDAMVKLNAARDKAIADIEKKSKKGKKR